MRSIKSGLTISLLTTILLLLAIGTLTGYIYVRSWMITQFDLVLFEKANAIFGMMNTEHGGIGFEIHDDIAPDFRRKNSPEYFQIRTTDGRLLEKSTSLKDGSMPWPESPDPSPQTWNLRLPDGRDGRVIYLKLSPDIDTEGEGRERNEEHGIAAREHDDARIITIQIMLARDRNELDKNLRLLLGGAVGFSVIMLLGVGIAIPFIVRRGLRPVTHLARHIQTVDSRSLDKRLSGAGVPLELKPIYLNYNELLERIEKAFLREKRMTADMAHELRTPISELRALTEVSLKHPDDVGFALESLREVNHVAIQMESIVSAMLTLSRVEAGIESLEVEATDLVALIRKHWHDFQDTGRNKNIDAALDLPENMRISTNQPMLTSILRNLLENAFEYCPENGKVSCRLTKSDSQAVLELRNSNSTIKEEDLSRMLKPFWCKQASRTDNNHSGLGLSLVQTLARALSATIEVSVETGDDFKIRLCLPTNSVAGNSHLS